MVERLICNEEIAGSTPAGPFMKRISDEQLAQDLVCMKRVTCKRCRFEKDCIATFNIGLSASIQDYAHDLNEARQMISRLTQKLKERK